MPTFTQGDILFLKYLDHDWRQYPARLKDHCELDKLVDDICRDFEDNKENILISEDSTSKKPAVFIHDYRNAPDLDHGQSSTDSKGQAALSVPEAQASTTGNDDHSSTIWSEDGSSSIPPWLQGVIKDSETLKKRIGWPMSPEGKSLIKKFVERDTAGEENPTGLKKDPACRLVFIETGVPVKNMTNFLKVTEDMLLQILAYHQVPPCYLDFLSYIVADLFIAESDGFFGGFRKLKSFGSPSNDIALPTLGRSSYRLQLTFALKAVFRPSTSQSEAGLARFDPYEIYKFYFPQHRHSRLRALFNVHDALPRPYSDKLDEVFPFNWKPMLTTQRWPVVQAAIHHHFDVKSGRAFWIIAAPGTDTSPAFKDLRGYHEDICIETEDKSQRFQSSLDMALWLSKWSLSQFASLIDFLDQDIRQKSIDIFDDFRLATTRMNIRADFEQRRLRAVNLTLEQIDECINSLKGNLRVLEALREFYEKELLLETDQISDLSWLEDEKDKISSFSQQLKIISTVTENFVRRAELLLKAGIRRQDLYYQSLHVRNESNVSELTSATVKDSEKMKGYATVTFFLLPMTVISTFFATDVVKFQGYDTLVGKWSKGAGFWFLGSMSVLMIIVYLMFRFGDGIVKLCWNALVDSLDWLCGFGQDLILPPLFRHSLHLKLPLGQGSSHPPPDGGSPAPNNGDRKVPSSMPSEPSTLHEQNNAAGNSNNNNLGAQQSRSNNSADAIQALPVGSGDSDSSLVKKRRNSSDLEKGYKK